MGKDYDAVIGFDDAVAHQQQAIAFAAFSGQTALVGRLEANLKRYLDGVPCRSPWAADDPIFTPPRGDAMASGS